MLKPGPNIGHPWIVIIGKDLLTTEQEANIKKVSKHACMHATRALLAIAFAWAVLSWIEHNLKAVKVGVKFT